MATPPEYASVSARVGPDLLQKLERYVQYLNQQQPGLNAKMSTAVRMLIVRGLEQVENEIGPLSSRRKG
jgi:hypothetical protein